MSYAMDNRRGMGTALYTRRLIEQLLKDDRFEWYLVHFDAVDDPLYKQAHEILIPYVRLPFATRFVRTMLFFWKYRKQKFDIIHWFQPRLYPFFWLTPAKHIVVTAHGAGDITAPGKFPFSRRAFNFVMKHFNRYIDAVIAVSEFGKREIEEHYRVPPEKVFVTYPGGGERFQPLSRDVAREHVEKTYGIAKPYIFDVSRLEPHKNVVRLTEAYIEARRRGVEQLLVIAGKDSGEGAAMRALVRDAGLESDVVLIPHADGMDLNALYAAADIFVFPSLNEGFGSPLAESMSVGTPIITSNSTAPPEVAERAALLVDPYDVEELSNAIVQLLSDENLRKRFGEQGLERSQEFRWSETARKTLQLYDTVLKRT